MSNPVHEPGVTLLAATGTVNTHGIPGMPDGYDTASTAGHPAEALVEFAGRGCYQSFHRPNPMTREAADYIAHILAVGHGSVLEHATATFYLTGLSRACTHELIRHRHLSFSQQSQRFVNEQDANYVIPPALQGMPGMQELLGEHAARSRHVYEQIVQQLQDQGTPRKQAREAARAVLPNMTETRITVTGNLRAWRHFIRLRAAEGADAEIRHLALVILSRLREAMPALVDDFEVTEASNGTMYAATEAAA